MAKYDKTFIMLYFREKDKYLLSSAFIRIPMLKCGR